MNKTERQKLWDVLDKWKVQIEQLETVKDDQHRFLEGEISGLEIAISDVVDYLDSIVPSDADVKLFKDNLALKKKAREMIDAWYRGYGISSVAEELRELTK